MLGKVFFAVLAVVGMSLVSFLGFSSFILEMITQILILGLFAVSLNILVGYTGMVSFGHSAFYGIGAYTVGIILKSTSLSIPTAMAIALVFSGLAAAIIGFFCTRLTAIYFAMLTLAFSQVVYAIVTKLESLTGGYQGLIGGIPKPPIELFFFSWDIRTVSGFYIFTVFTVILCLLCINVLLNSPFGCILKAIKENSERTSYVGINVRGFQITAFIVSGSFAGVSGALMALYISGAYPDFIFWTTSAEPIFMILIGGASTFLGPVIGAMFLFLLTSYLSAYTQFWGLVVGGAIVCFTVLLKKGLTEIIVRSRWYHSWGGFLKSRFYGFVKSR